MFSIRACITSFSSISTQKQARIALSNTDPEPPSFCISVITTPSFLQFFLHYYYCFFFLAVLHWHFCIPALLHYLPPLHYGITKLSGRKRTVPAIPSPCCGETPASCCPLYTIEKQAIFTNRFTSARPRNTEPSLMR